MEAELGRAYETCGGEGEGGDTGLRLRNMQHIKDEDLARKCYLNKISVK